MKGMQSPLLFTHSGSYSSSYCPIGAIVQMARNCAYDFAKYNIRVNSICAGTIETPISVEERKAHNWTYDHWEKLKTKDVMMGRVGHVREIANATLFFASDERYIIVSQLMYLYYFLLF